MLIDLKQQGIEFAYCTHIGLDTFAPVREEDPRQHRIHRERAILLTEDAQIINEAKLRGNRVVAVGTTSVRTLETAAIRSAAYGTAHNDPHSVQATLAALDSNTCPWRPVIAIDEETDLYIIPGFRFRVTDAMLTNFHLPRSTLLMLVSAFAERAHPPTRKPSLAATASGPGRRLPAAVPPPSGSEFNGPRRSRVTIGSAPGAPYTNAQTGDDDAGRPRDLDRAVRRGRRIHPQPYPDRPPTRAGARLRPRPLIGDRSAGRHPYADIPLAASTVKGHAGRLVTAMRGSPSWRWGRAHFYEDTP